MEHYTSFSLDCLVFALSSAFAVRAAPRIVANPVLVWFSLISYNLYLWQKGVIWYCHDNGFPCWVSARPWQTISYWGYVFPLMATLWSILVAVAVTYLLERPLLALRPAWLLRARGRPLAPAGYSQAPSSGRASLPAHSPERMRAEPSSERG